RKPQIALAKKLKLTNYPTPAGGCLLTDPGFAKRVKTLYQETTIPTATDLNLLKYGRFYPLAEASSFVIVGRHRDDNQQLLKTADHNYFTLHLAEMAGPVAILKGEKKHIPFAARKLCQHSKAKNLSSVKVNWRQGSESGNLTVEKYDN
ncbi:MAG: hypothetical protein U9Q39_00755, partial [Pseudomonadota bacterium]|nr:hypothetical protein [Pseudomonadota bacterium]